MFGDSKVWQFNYLKGDFHEKTLSQSFTLLHVSEQKTFSFCLYEWLIPNWLSGNS